MYYLVNNKTIELRALLFTHTYLLPFSQMNAVRCIKVIIISVIAVDSFSFQFLQIYTRKLFLKFGILLFVLHKHVCIHIDFN